ncbi:MAG TPA: hypothetical protein VHW60_22240 [Caulobacteraceae bacterium]|jgi:hypothetical protein|nr:hypothetical protein [Caulobacteraceae bacterium]
MPKLIDRALSAVRSAPPPLTSAEIERRLTATRQTLAGLVSEHPRAALDAEAGLDGAPQRLADNVAQQDAARQRIVTLESAMVAAREGEALDRTKLQARLRKENVGKVLQALQARDRAADRLQAALQAAAVAWRDLLTYSERAALPIPGLPEAHGVVTTPHEIARAVEREIWRVGTWPKAAGASPGRDPRNMPGGNPHGFDFEEQPNALPKLADEMRRASDHAARQLTGEPLDRSK